MDTFGPKEGVLSIELISDIQTQYVGWSEVSGMSWLTGYIQDFLWLGGTVKSVWHCIKVLWWYSLVRMV